MPRLKHDSLVKSMFQEPTIAQDFLKEYLPKNIQQNVDFNATTLEKTSFIEDNLKNSFVDVIFKLKTRDDQQIYAYTFLEHQSTVDNLIPLRLWGYILQLITYHLNNYKTNKIPLIYPIVLYNGKNKYTAHKNLWDLFSQPELAKQILTNDHLLINLQAMSEQDILQKKELAV